MEGAPDPTFSSQNPWVAWDLSSVVEDGIGIVYNQPDGKRNEIGTLLLECKARHYEAGLEWEVKASACWAA